MYVSGKQSQYSYHPMRCGGGGEERGKGVYHLKYMKGWENLSWHSGKGFVIYSCLKDSAFTTVKRDAAFYTRR